MILSANTTSTEMLFSLSSAMFYFYLIRSSPTSIYERTMHSSLVCVNHRQFPHDGEVYEILLLLVEDKFKRD